MVVTDLSLISPLFRMMGLLGPIGGERASRVVSAYVLAFFDRYPKGQPQPLLDGPSAEFPEVEFARVGAGAGREREDDKEHSGARAAGPRRCATFARA